MIILHYCNKYRKSKNPKISYIFYKTLVLSIISGKFGVKDKIIFQEEESIDILQIFGVINNVKEN